MNERIAYSFVVDEHPKFAYQAWHLARSLQTHCNADRADIHVQFTPEVSDGVRKIFDVEGYTVHMLERFGDGRWCNKLGQLPNLFGHAFDRVVLLDTDTIVVSDLRPFLGGNAVQAKIVDVARPSLDVLHKICRSAGGRPAGSVLVDAARPSLNALRKIWRFAHGRPADHVLADASGDLTMTGNSNGGFYAVPRSLVESFSAEWRRWASWLLTNDEPLRVEGRLDNIDQVSAALAFSVSGIAWVAAPSNVNYFVHFSAKHRYFDRSKPIALLHYHDISLNFLGLLQPPVSLNAEETAAVAQANRQISEGFHNVLFWNFRYSAFPESGSGKGSRGSNLIYKRDLLRREGLESAGAVLDVGCGDGEVLRGLSIKNYLGLDVAEGALEKAKAARPDGDFLLYQEQPIPPRDVVLCLEVLIHQPTLTQYLAIVSFLATHTLKTLFVSGYEHKDQHHMVFFHEPLSQSLAATCRFARITAIGAHSDVAIFRCDV